MTWFCPIVDRYFVHHVTPLVPGIAKKSARGEIVMRAQGDVNYFAPAHYGSEQPDSETWYHSFSHKLGSE